MRSRYRIPLAAVLCFWLIPGGHLAAQDPYYIRYNVDNGLPSNEVYGIVFDNNKVLWGTTDRGVFRFDGYEFTTRSVNEGLKENTNLNIYHDPATDRIYVASLNNYLTCISGDSVYSHPLSATIHQMGGFWQYIHQIRFTDDSTLLLSYNRPGLYRLSPGRPADTVAGHRIRHTGAAICVFYEPDGYYWDMIRIPDTVPAIRSSLVREGNEYYLSCGLLPMNHNYRTDLHPLGPDEFLLAFGHKVFHIRGDDLLDERVYDTEVSDVYADSHRNFWVGLINGGIFMYPGGSFRSEPLRYLKDKSITGIEQDHEGNFWFSTANHGIFLARSQPAIVYFPETTSEEDKHVTALESHGNDLYLGTLSGRLYRASPGTAGIYRMDEISIPPATGAVRRIVVTPEGFIYLFKDELLLTDLSGEPAGFGRYPSFGYDMARLRNGSYMVSFLNWGEVIRDNQLRKTITPDSISRWFPGNDRIVKVTNRARNLLVDSRYRLWIGSQDGGVFSADRSGVHPWVETDPELGLRTRDIIQVGEDVWVSVSDFGIRIIHPDSTITPIMKKDGLSSDIVDVLFSRNDSVVWAGTSEGLNRIRITGPEVKTYEIEYFTQNEGFPSKRIYHILEHQGVVWVATSRGLVRLNPDYMEPAKSSPVLIFDRFSVNGDNRAFHDQMHLGHRDNNLVFRYKVISYRPHEGITYWYKLDGLDKNWTGTRNTEVRYPELKSGNYTFRVAASYPGDTLQKAELSLDLQIRKSWVETNFFRLLAGLASLSVLIMIFRLLIKDLKKRELQKQQMLRSEKRALLSQMNPHFIFNSLNSIQHFIIQHDEIQANNYLTSFSSLMRRILDNSGKNLITLNEEIATLGLYLELEKLRFEEDFDFRIIKDPEIDYNELMIPPMLIQPFVENAIWHGLTPLEGKGCLIISFTRLDDRITVNIRDNGIGRDRASLKNHKNRHRQTGIRNVEERIALLNQLNPEKIKLSIVDLKNPDGSASGTQVELLIPDSWSYQFLEDA